MKNFIKNKKNVNKKASIDFDADSIQIMEELKDQYKARSYSSIVNMMLHTFGQLNNSVREELVGFCNRQSALEFKIGSDNAYTISDVHECRGQYQSIIDFLTIGKRQQLNIKEVVKMKKSYISNGYCVVPEDWIEIPFDRAEESEYVGVVEVRNGSKYDVPHFYFFSTKPIRFLTKYESEHIEHECSLKSLAFRNAMRHRVEAVEGEDGLILNEKEWLSAPECGIFQMGVHGDRDTFPYGAMIYHVDDIAYEPKKDSDESDDDEDFPTDEELGLFNSKEDDDMLSEDYDDYDDLD